MNTQTGMMAATKLMATAAAATEEEEKATGLPPTEVVISMLVSLVPLGAMLIYVNVLVLKMLRREMFAFGDYLRTYTILNILLLVPAIVTQGIITLMYPAAEVIGIEFCHVSMTFSIGNDHRVLVHSLVMALFKYVHTVHSGFVANVGHKKINILIQSIAWIYILIQTTNHMVPQKGIDPIFWVNLCYGHDDTKGYGYQVENTAWNRFKSYACLTDDYGLNTRFGAASSTTATFLHILCFVSLVSGLIVFSNVVDTVLYYKLYKYINR